MAAIAAADKAESKREREGEMGGRVDGRRDGGWRAHCNYIWLLHAIFSVLSCCCLCFFVCKRLGVDLQIIKRIEKKKKKSQGRAGQKSAVIRRGGGGGEEEVNSGRKEIEKE